MPKKLLICLCLLFAAGCSAMNENTVSFGPSVIRPYGVTASMDNPDFWGASDDEMFRKASADFISQNADLLADDRLEEHAAPFRKPRRGDLFDVAGKRLPDSYADALYENTKGENFLQPAYAVAVRPASLRVQPSDVMVLAESGDYCDAFQVAALSLGEPLRLLAKSADGRFFLAVSSYAAGWVLADKVALTDERDWQKFRRPERFIVSLSALTPLRVEGAYPRDDDEYVLLTQGTRILLDEESPRIVNGRMAFNAYRALLPERSAEGKLVLKKVLVPVSQDFSEGYLPLTAKNAVRLAYRSLGQIYGWGGSHLSNDCSGYLRGIFAAMGLFIPKTTTHQAVMPTNTVKIPETAGRAERLDILRKAPAGSILYFKGHVLMHLGVIGDTAYAVHASGSSADADGGEILPFHQVAVTTLDLRRRNGKTMLMSIEKVKLMSDR